MLYGHVHKTTEYEYIKQLRKTVKVNSMGYGTPIRNFINVGAMMPNMNYTPGTLTRLLPLMKNTANRRNIDLAGIIIHTIKLKGQEAQKFSDLIAEHYDVIKTLHHSLDGEIT